MTSTDSANLLIPATRVTVPDDTIRVTGMKSHMASEGVAFNATVRQGKTIIGFFENEGRGGGTMFRGNSAEANAAFETWATAYGAIQPEPVTGWAAHERAADALVDAYEITKLLKIKPGRTHITADPGDGPIDTMDIKIVKSGDVTAIAQHFENHLYWDGDAWVPLPTA
jgi:hypothetical protein